jgi:N-acylneuraminate cytidylyltransferase/CMP-N,N'-diacetyllegionaminic acid synthase
MLELKDLIIQSNESLRTGLQRMTRNRKGILFVCDTDQHLVGALSDGDVRRTLLDDTLLVAAVSKAMNTDPITARTVEEGVSLLRRLTLVAVAITSANGRVTEIVVEDGEGTKVLRSTQPEEKEFDGAAERARAVAIIPARGGSKRIPRKNLGLIAGKTLLAWAIIAAKEAHNVGRVVVSTDDMDVAEEAQTAGAEVPWLRPAELAQDDTPTLDVVLHALKWSLETTNPAPQLAVLLEPTAPLRSPEHIEQAIEMLATSGADSVVSVCELPHVFHPEELVAIENGRLQPYLRSRTMDSRKLRGQQSPVYVCSGLVYAFRISSVLQHRSLYGPQSLPLITSWEYFLDVDTPEDLHLADLKKRRVQKS